MARPLLRAVIGAALLSLLASPVLAHAELISATPGPGDIVAVMTGWDARFGDESYLEHPVIDVALADALWQRGVRVLGVDTLNPDASWPGEDGAWHLPVHELWLGRGGVIVENLAHLDRAPAQGAEAIILPLKLAGADGAPVRAVARVPNAG